MSCYTLRRSSVKSFIFVGSLVLASILNWSTSSAQITDTNLYYPPDYLTFQPPDAGGSYIDPVFGSAIKRLSNAMTMPDLARGSGVVTAIAPEYSTMTPFNTDNTRLLLTNASYFGLYDGDGNFLRSLPFEVNTSSEPRWSRTDPNVFYYVSGNKLKQYNIGTDSATVVHTFSEYTRISGKGESDICFDGDHFVLAGDNRYVFVYEISTDEKGPVLDAGAGKFDDLYITPNDNVLVGYYAAGSNRFNGFELYDRNMNFVRQIAHALGHQDVTIDTTGEEVLLWANGADPDPQVRCDAGVVKIRLSDGEQTCVWTQGSWTNAYHISAPDNSGWFFMDTYAPSDPIPPTGWNVYTNELLQVKLDGTEVRRLAHHRSRPFNSYTWQPRISTSRDGTKVVFGSNFGLQAILGYPTEYSDAYMIDMGSGSSNPPPTLSAVYLGVTGEDNVGPGNQLSANGIPDWHIQLHGLRGTPTTVRITSAVGGVWETPWNELGYWVILPGYDGAGNADLWFEPWASPGFHVKVWYSDGSTDESDVL